jgi:phospholipid/cholesterol/gamma-HCH transport system ATP-binding protein
MEPATVRQADVAPLRLENLAALREDDPDRVAFAGVNWTIERNQFWVVGGFQGAGKSTLLGVLAGILRPASGDLWLFGQRASLMSDEARQRELLKIGLVFEGDGRVFTRLTVADNIALPVRYHGRPKESETLRLVEEALAWTGLAACAREPAGRINRRLQRRLALARALVLRPEVLLVDDPLARLDPRESAWWLDFLNRLAHGHPWQGDQPLTLVVTTGDFRPWRLAGRHFALLDQGRFTEIGKSAGPTQAPDSDVREVLAELGMPG